VAFSYSRAKKTADKFIDGNDRRIVCILNKTETFQAALMPDGKGDFFILVNKKLRDKLKVQDMDEILVELEKDTSEFGLPMPEEFAELLEQDDQGKEPFYGAHRWKETYPALYHRQAKRSRPAHSQWHCSAHSFEA
jgi:hypothetical protein